MDESRRVALLSRVGGKQWKDTALWNDWTQSVPANERWSCVVEKNGFELFIRLAGNGAVLITLYRRPNPHAIKEYIDSAFNVVPEPLPVLSMVMAVSDMMVKEATN